MKNIGTGDLSMTAESKASMTTGGKAVMTVKDDEHDHGKGVTSWKPGQRAPCKGLSGR